MFVTNVVLSITPYQMHITITAITVLGELQSYSKIQRFNALRIIT